MVEVTLADRCAAMKFLAKVDGLNGAYLTVLASAFAEYREAVVMEALTRQTPAKLTEKLIKAQT